jgi:hypothetical protein
LLIVFYNYLVEPVYVNAEYEYTIHQGITDSTKTKGTFTKKSNLNIIYYTIQSKKNIYFSWNTFEYIVKYDFFTNL